MMLNNVDPAVRREEALNDGDDIKVAVNSIQRTLFVERLTVNVAYPQDRIIPYDNDNLYPNKVKSIAQRSGSTMSAIQTLSSFVSGDGFPYMETIINRENQNLWDICRHISLSKAMFNGFALHFNYNLMGQIVEIWPINFEAIRWDRDIKKLVYNPDWSRKYIFKNKEVIYTPFNHEKTFEEIQQAGDINKYKGQLYYWIPNKKDHYTTCTWDSVLDDAQFEAEVKLYSLSSIQNNYSLDGIITYPKNIENTEGKEEVKKELRNDKGSANAGGVRVIPAPVVENMNNWKWFTPISRANIDNLHTNQIERAKFNIYAAFRQPPILNGISSDGMFNEASFADAFNYYNSATETERKEVESELNKIISKSVWANLGKVEIIPKKYVTREVNTPAGQAIQASESQQELNSTLTNLTGRQLQGVFRITRKFKKGELTHDQAALMLRDGFGFADDQIEVWLINDEGDL